MSDAAAIVKPVDEGVPGWAVQLLVDVGVIKSTLAPIKDHEDRIRSLERRAYLLAGAAAVLGAAGSKLLDLIQIN